MEQETEHHVVPFSTFVKVWLALITLTGVTIYVAGLHLGRFSTLTAVIIASVKASLVLWFFMHLKYEKRIFKVILLVPIATLAVIIGLTFTDVLFR